MLQKFVQLLFFVFAFFLIKDIVYAAEIKPFPDTSVNVGFNENDYPYQFINDKGQAEGILIDFWVLWGQKLGLKINFKPVNEISLSSALEQKRIDFHAGVSKEHFNFKHVQQLLSHSHVLMRNNFFIRVNRTYSSVNTMADLLPFSIGVLANSSHYQYLKRYFPELTVRQYSSEESLFQAALDKKIIAFSGIDKYSYAPEYSKKITALFPQHKRIHYFEINYRTVVKSTNLALLRYIEQGVKEISEQEKSSIKEKWLGSPKNKSNIVLSYSEQSFPYIHLSSKGKTEGFLAELWQLWSEYTGVMVDFIRTSEIDAKDKLRNTQVDVHIDFLNQPVDKQILKRNFQLYKRNIKLFVSTKLKNVAQVYDVKNKKIAAISNSAYKEILQEKYPDINFIFYQSLNHIIDAAQVGEIDGFIGDDEKLMRLIEDAKLSRDFYPLSINIYQPIISTIISQKNLTLNHMILDGFASIPASRLIELEKKWLTHRQTYYFQQQAERSALSTQNKQWLLEHPVIRVGMLNNWSPMEFVNEANELAGINSDFFDLIELKLGSNFIKVPFNSWPELMSALKDKKIDMVASASYSDEREKLFNFTKPYWSMPWALMHPLALGNKVKLSDFNGKYVAVLEGIQIADILRVKYPKIKLIEVSNLEDAYILLQEGKVKALIANLASSSELLKRESFISMGLSILDNFALQEERIVMRKDWSELTDIMNHILDSITTIKKQEIYDKWFSIEVSTGFEKNVVIKVAIQVGVFTIIVIAIIIFWNRRLYLEIRQRKLLESQMKHMATHDELTGLANRSLLTERINTSISFHQRQKLTLAVLFIDLDGFKHVNDNYGHDVGDELLVQLSQRLKDCVRESDTVARFGGDEFVLLLTGLHDKKESAFIAEKVLKVIRRPVTLSAATVAVSCSIGIAAFPDDGTSDTDLLKIADTLMYRVKAHGKNHYLFY